MKSILFIQCTKTNAYIVLLSFLHIHFELHLSYSISYGFKKLEKLQK